MAPDYLKSGTGAGLASMTRSPGSPERPIHSPQTNSLPADLRDLRLCIPAVIVRTRLDGVAHLMPPKSILTCGPCDSRKKYANMWIDGDTTEHDLQVPALSAHMDSAR
jgi:hypothetical protein